MNNAPRVIATKVLAVLLSLSLLLTASGCLPLVIYELGQDRQGTTPPPQTEIVTQGEYNDLSFEELCSVLFEYEVTWDNLSLNQLVVDPEALGIEAPRPATLGDYSYEANVEDMQFYAEILEALTGGHTVDRDELDDTDRLVAEMIEGTLSRALEYEQFYYYYEPLSPSTGAQANLPLNLMDYSFRTVDDIEIYLELLADTPRLFDQLIEFEWEKKDLGVMMSSQAMEDTIDEARAYTGDPATHVLTTVFNEMLDKAIDSAGEGSDLVGLTGAEIEDFKTRNLEGITDSIVPAYEDLLTSLEELLPYCNEDTRLYDYGRGTEYYELEMEAMGFAEGPTSSINTLETALEGYWTIIAANSSDLSWESMVPASVVQAIGEGPEDYVAYIQEHSTNEFAPADELTYEIKIAPEASPNDYAMAYFMLPPVDNPLINYIVYFPRNISDEVELYSTMAHEAYPGHMYQVYAYSLEDPPDIAKLYGCLAYMEGWAMYAQEWAMRCLDSDEGGISAYVAYEKFIYGLYARVDLGVNFEGWSVRDTERYLADWGFESAAESMYDVCIKQPVSYLAYGLGVVEFDLLRERAESHLGQEFNAVEYHQFITGLGAVPFDILEREFEVWLRATESQDL